MKITFSKGTIDTDLIIQAMLENEIVRLDLSKSYDKEAFDIEIHYQTPIIEPPKTII